MSDLLPRYDRIVLLCPHVITGGPEAIHQLSDAIIDLGGDVTIAYYGRDVACQIEDDSVKCEFYGNPTPDIYRHYQCRIARHIPLTERSLIIYPESVLLWALTHRPFSVALWWLSVDNALIKAPQLSYESFRTVALSKEPFLHFFQSDYARDYLVKAGAKNIYPLSDYINRRYLTERSRKKIGGIIAFFPRKGGEMAKSFFDNYPDLKRCPLENMNAEKMKEALQQTQIYIDFGHHPGKDRIPREAAASGNIIFLHERGAAAHPLDHPLDRFFMFTADDISNGSLYARVNKVIADPDYYWSMQHAYHARIAVDYEMFRTEVKSLFFTPRWQRSL